MYQIDLISNRVMDTYKIFGSLLLLEIFGKLSNYVNKRG